ncbi:f-box domain containing protein [Grosmannia clavigera kw1407]|uniref:F-box domain containing protein n=1 Tax=Grosmannia clavigera (strain kw1407 / UAMH 11150) TaxID=655863 RepID=F0XB95_GROCL|nr:f-box domain containing protein [Grosmannia clavigera kw1407]EFX05071.1 f-box domain containing protein [Grosmannia clavigera kw1407]
MGRPCPKTAFVIPTKLLEASPNTDAHILRLPTELLLSFLSLISTEDKICFALTCKRILQASTLQPFLIPSVDRHRSLGPCRHMQGLLARVKPRDAKGRKKKTIAICAYCVRYRPKKPSYWEKFFREGVSEAQWTGQLDLWSRLKIGECPECWYKRAIAQLQQLAAEKVAADIEAQLASEIAAQNAIATQNGDQAQNDSESDDNMDDISLYTTSSGYGPSEYESTRFDSEEEELGVEDSEDYSDEESSSKSDVDMEM